MILILKAVYIYQQRTIQHLQKVRINTVAGHQQDEFRKPSERCSITNKKYLMKFFRTNPKREAKKTLAEIFYAGIFSTYALLFAEQLFNWNLIHSKVLIGLQDTSAIINQTRIPPFRKLKADKTYTGRIN